MSRQSVLQPWLAALHAQRRRVVIGFLLMLLTAFAGIALLGLSGWFISAAAVFVVAFDIFVPGAAIRTLALVRTLSRYGERLYNHDLILRLQQRWRVTLFEGLVRQPLLVSERFRLAHVLQRLTQDLTALDDLYIRVLAPFALVTVSAGMLGFGLLLLSPLLGLLVWGAAGLLVALHGLVLAARLRDIAGRELQASEDLRQSSLSLVESKAELHAWQVLPQALAQHHEQRTALSSQQRLLRRRLTILQAGVELWSLLAVVGVLTVAIQGALSGLFSVPLAVLSGLAVLAMLDQWLLLPQASLLWGRISGAAHRLQPMLEHSQLGAEEPLERGSVPPEKLIPRATGADIELYNLRISGRQLPAALSLRIAGGQVTVLSGTSGGGKSSLLMFLAGALPRQQGDVYLASQPLSEPLLTLDAALLTQHNAILAQSVAVNLRLASTSHSDDELWHMLELVELADTVEQLPQQLDSWLGDGGIQLSGGQQRRLALARTLLFAQQRDVLLLDEPFNGVGEAQAARIWQRIVPLCAGKTVFIASHQSSPFDAPGAAYGVVQLALESCYNPAPHKPQEERI